MSRRGDITRRSGVWLAPLAVLVLLALLVSSGVALMMAPALLLLAVLLDGRAPGEDVLERWRRSAVAVPPRRRVALRVAPPRLALVVRPVGRLLAAALAVRPPPAGPLVA